MTIRAFKSPDDLLALSALRTADQAGTPDAARLPANLRGTPRSFQLQLGEESRLFLHDDARTPGLYVDTDGDEDFSNEARIPGSRAFPKPPLMNTPPLDRFGQVALYRHAGGPIAFVAVQGTTLKTCPARYLQGRGMVGGKSRLFALLDRNLNGAYDDVCPMPAKPADLANADGLFVDRNGNGRFERVASGFWEIQPLTAAISLDDARHKIAVEPDGSAIELRPVRSESGRLQVARNMDMLLVSDCGFIQLERDNEWALPAGKYHGKALSIISDRDSEVFRYEAGAQLGQLAEFEIEPRRTLQVPAGARVRLQGSTTSEDGKPKITLASDTSLQPGATLEDDAGILYTAIRIKEQKPLLRRPTYRPGRRWIMTMPILMPAVYGLGPAVAVRGGRPVTAGCPTSYG